MAGYLGGMMEQGRGDSEGMTAEDRSGSREFKDDAFETRHIGGREPPSSQVGYGGGDRSWEFPDDAEVGGPHSSLDLQDHPEEGPAHGGRFVGGHGRSDPRSSENQPVKTSSGKYVHVTDGVPASHSRICDANSKPCDSGYGSSSPCGYTGAGGSRVSDEKQGPAHQSKTCDGNSKPCDSGYGRSAPFGYTGAGGSRVSSEEHVPAHRSKICDGNSKPWKPCDSGYGSSAPCGYSGAGGSRVSGEERDPAHQSKICDGNSKPCDSGYGSSAPCGYTGAGGSRASGEEHGPDHQSKVCDGNSKPCYSGYGSSAPCGYTGAGGSRVIDEEHPKSHDGKSAEEGGERRIHVTYKSQHYRDGDDHYGGLPAPMRPPGAELRSENDMDGPKYENEPTTSTDRTQSTSLPSERVQESEVRGGHHGVELGEYYQRESLPAGPDGSAYSEQYTQPDAPSTHASELQDTYQCAKATPMEETDMAPAATDQADDNHKGGLMAKIKSHIPGHHKHHAGTDVNKDHATSTTTSTEREDTGFVEKIKHKLTPAHHHHQPETSEQ